MRPFFKQRLAVAVLLAAAAGGVSAQETTSAIRGKIYSPNGDPMSNASVVVIDTRTGVERTYTTNASGSFYAPNLAVGGPYKVVIDGKEVLVNSIKLGDVYNLTYGGENSSIEEVMVVAEGGYFDSVAVGPSATFGLFELENAVTISRDITEVISLDPRINVDPGGGINCAGKHPRFNSTTLDGVSQNDRFGLNPNGYSTATGMPFPFAAIEQVSVELAPYDVNYGGFSACTINAVSRAGENEFHGGVFYQYTDDGLRGDTLDFGGGDSTKNDLESYDEFRRGFDLGGPIIKDKLFFYVAYEESEEPEFIAQGVAGTNNGEVRDWLSQSDFDRISNIAQNVYGYNPGGMPGNGVQEEEKYSARLDWAITDDHSVSLIYNHYEGFENRASDDDDDEFEFANHFYTKGAESETITAKWSAQWTDNFSTEVFFSQNEMNDSQVNVADQGFAEMQITVDDNTVYLGTDDSRQSNALDTDSDYFKINAQYLAGDHIITGGYEQEALSVFNLFVQHSDGGEIRFDSIDDFEAGLASRFYYGSGGGTNNANDAAASFENVLHTFYLQDEWYIGNANLTLVYGLRYEKFTSDDTPNYNPAFEEEFGFSNAQGLDGLDLLMPRFGFTWETTDTTTIRGGIGLFSGGNPNVWISNAWSNDGVTNVQIREDDVSLFDVAFANGATPGFGPTQSLYDTVAATTAADGAVSFTNVIDPDYEQPGEWKISLGVTHEFDSGWVLDADFIYSRLENAAYYQDISQSIVGFTSTGAPIYDYYGDAVDVYMLTNSSYDAEGFVASLGLSKAFDNGLTVNAGYALTQSEDISPMTSSTAGSNFDNTALLDINNPKPGTSNYETPHRFSLNLNYRKEFIEGLETSITLTGVRRQGQGSSYVMSGLDLEGDGFFGRHLLYVPTGTDDPNVIFTDPAEEAAFYEWAAKQGLSGGYVARNEVNAKWSTLVNLAVRQEIPSFSDNTHAEVYLLINNLGNLLNDRWGHQYDGQFFSQQVVDTEINDQGQYVYSNFREGDVNDLVDELSYWEAQIGINFRF